MSVTDEQPTIGDAAAKAVAPARPVRQAVAAHHSAGHDRRNADLCARDRQFPDQPAERPAGGGEYRGAGARCRPLGHGSGFAGAADSRQHRRARGRHQDGAATPAAGQRRFAAGDRSRCRHAHHDGVVGDRRFLRDHAGERQPGDPRDRAGARRRAIHRGGDRRGCRCARRCTGFPAICCWFRWGSRCSPRGWSIWRCIICSCGRCGG